MNDTVMTDLVNDESTKQEEPKRTQKRKRSSPSPLLNLTKEDREAQIENLNNELKSLFAYYREIVSDKPLNQCQLDEIGSNGINNIVAVLIEESELSLSKLVDEVYEKVKERLKTVAVAVAAVKSAVLFVGQRIMYGVPNLDADVLEDESELCLWCWETRDLKLIPKSVCGTLKIRRTCRKKISERIIAVDSMLAALQSYETDINGKRNLLKASDKLTKVLSEADIRLLVDTMVQKNGASLAEKEVKREEKLLIKQLEKNKREADQEKKRIERELQKEKLNTEREQKLMQEEAEREEKRREKEESEMRKRVKRKQEETEKEQRRREKEEAENKKQLSIKKQASIMERFLKTKNTSPCQKDKPSAKVASDPTTFIGEKMAEAVTCSMDCALSADTVINADDIWKSHVSSWRQLGHSIRSNRNQGWGLRQKPKTDLFKELKLSTNKELTQDDNEVLDKGSTQTSDVELSLTNAGTSLPDVKKFKCRRQLLQFDKSHRPAFYGFWPKRSLVVGPRHPLKKDPDLDYDVDSDEEWEEEDPGESLSDSDKEGEDEISEGVSKADDDDESEDGFFVPDGYLSEDEGQVDKMDTDLPEDKSSPKCKIEIDEEFCALLQQQKYLSNLTEQALRKNQPLIILNLMNEKAPLLTTDDLSGNLKMERTCLQVLSMHTFPGAQPVEISLNPLPNDDQEASPSNAKSSTARVPSTPTIADSDLPTFVSVIQSCSSGINKVIEALHEKFPSISKTQLRNKVRDISDFSDNHWQVKKKVLDSLGISVSPENKRLKTKKIASFFSKRCLPPSENKNINLNEGSPMSSTKSTSDEGRPSCSLDTP
ncbi:hypothetical protein ACFE04_027981 [Oxalis oulophora]